MGFLVEVKSTVERFELSLASLALAFFYPCCVTSMQYLKHGCQVPSARECCYVENNNIGIINKNKKNPLMNASFFLIFH